MSDALEIRKIAVLGASGFLGVPICNFFKSKGWEVCIFSRKTQIGPLHNELFADLFDPKSLENSLNIAKPNVVISTAWDTEHGKFWTNEANIAYRDATLKFAALSFEAGVETFIGIGTGFEYGSFPGICEAETSSLVESDIYSKSKIETGLGLKALGEKYERKTHWARVFQAFGPNEKLERFIPSLITNLTKEAKFSIRAPDNEMDWIHTTDVASAIVFSLENNLNHFIDVGTGVGTSVRGLSELICREFDLDVSLLDFSEQVPGHTKRAVVSPRSQLLSLGWQPTESLRNRIRSLQ